MHRSSLSRSFLTRRICLPLTVIALAIAAAGIGATPAAAASIVVTQTDDSESGPGCTLRQAIRAANANAPVLFCFHPGTSAPDTIVLPAGTYALSQAGVDDTAEDGDLDIADDLTIVGAGAADTIIDATDMTNERAFQVLSGVTATISGVTITGGRDNGFSGGGVLNQGTLTLDGVRVTENETSATGGGVSNDGTLTVRRSTIDNNRALAGAGLVHAGGSATLVSTTISGNEAIGSGGGVLSSAPGTLTHVTITRNVADADGEDVIDGDGGGLVATNALNLARSIVADNTDGSPGAEAPDCVGGPTSQGHNVIGDTSGCSFVAHGTDRVDVDAMVAPVLKMNGGPTPTHRLLGGSPALDRVPAADASCGGTDQRGVPRPQRAGCDAGAYELALCMGRTVGIVGTPGADALVGTAGDDVVLALGGRDVIRTRGGRDTVCGGPGADTIRLGGGPDRARGEGGGDLIVGGGQSDVLRGNGGSDRLRGGAGRDRLFGEGGNDDLHGGGGRDRCRQGPGSGRVRSCEA
ncbi:MAG TPA: choice-of-anchor Q domain-containing protein [Actinomycetota bacterium]